MYGFFFSVGEKPLKLSATIFFSNWYRFKSSGKVDLCVLFFFSVK